MLKLLWISEEKKNKLKLTKVDWMISLNWPSSSENKEPRNGLLLILCFLETKPKLEQQLSLKITKLRKLKEKLEDLSLLAIQDLNFQALMKSSKKLFINLLTQLESILK